MTKAAPAPWHYWCVHCKQWVTTRFEKTSREPERPVCCKCGKLNWEQMATLRRKYDFQ